MGLLLGLSLLVLAACGAQGSAKGGGGQEHKSTTGDSDATNGQIVFRRWLDETHAASFTMNPDGSHVSQITHPPKGFLDDFPEWSPDGKRLAFLRDAIDGSGGSQIIVLNTDTGDEHQVTRCTGQCTGDFDPAWAPDGHSLAFRHVINTDTPSGEFAAIWIVGLDGSNPHQVTNVDPKPPSDTKFADWWPQFSPNGKTLAFDRIRLGTPSLDYEDERHAVFVQRIDSSGSPEDAHQLTPWSKNCGITPDWSPDGKLILFRCGPWLEGPSNLYWVHPDGTGLHKIGHSRVGDRSYLGSGFSPSFSEGEGWITTSWDPGYGKEGNADVARMLIEGGDVVHTTNLTKSALSESAPDWGTHPPVH